MKTHSQNFVNSIRGINEINALLTYESENEYYILTTEGEDSLTTELEDILTTQKGNVIMDAESIYRINPSFNVELYKTICESVEVETTHNIDVNTWVNVKIGVKVGNEYEYIDFGDYIIKNKIYNVDTNTYTIIAYNRIIESMIDYDLSVVYPITIKDLLIAICNRFGWNYDIDTFVNYNKTINKDIFSNLGLTYRDVLDYISQIVAGNIKVGGNTLKICYINNFANSTTLPFMIPETINQEIIDDDRTITEDDITDTDVSINKKFGKVNSLIITSNGTTINNIEDTESIEQDGKTQIEMKDNVILEYNSNDYISEMFEVINGLEYYLYDFDTFGKLIFDPLDEVIIRIGDNDYRTLILNSDIKVTTGITESLYANELETTTQEIVVTNKQEKKVNDALISIDKANAQVVLKATSDGRISEVRLDGDAESGSEFNVSADNINFTGHNFNVTTDNMKITIGTGDNQKDLVNTSGVLTNLVYNGFVRGRLYVGNGDYIPLGRVNGGEDGYTQANELVFSFDLPYNFEIVSAKIYLCHAPINWKQQEETDIKGNSRNLKLYQAINMEDLELNINLSYGNINTSGVYLSEIQGALGENGYTGSTNQMESIESIELKNYISSNSENYLVIKDSDTTYYQDDYNIFSRTGGVYAYIEIIGYTHI